MSNTTITQEVQEPISSSFSKTVSDLPSQWREFAERNRQMGLPDFVVAVYHALAKSLEAALASEQNTTLSLEEASTASGYSVDHIGRLLRKGQLPNVGRKFKPRVRVADLPRHRQVVKRDSKKYDPVADALSLRSRGKRTV